MVAESRTFVQSMRRRQFVDCAIDAIADRGEAGASISEVARRAGVSRGVVLYHFGDRASLVEALVAHIYDLGHVEVGSVMQTETEPAARLDAFVRASLSFYVTHAREITALGRLYAGGSLIQHGQHPEAQQEKAALEALFRDGQEQGRFCAFDVTVMAESLRGILDSAHHALQRDPARLEQLQDELRAHVRRATARR